MRLESFLVAGDEVELYGLRTESMNGQRGTVMRAAPGGDSRFVIKLGFDQSTKPPAIKAANLRLLAAPGSIDLRSLAPWRAPARIPDPLHQIFGASMPTAARMSIGLTAMGASRATPADNLDPLVQWIYSMEHLGGHLDGFITMEHLEAGPRRRFLLEAPDESCGISIDVIAVLCCPPEVPTFEYVSSAGLAEAQVAALAVAPPPLLAVRFMSHTKDDPGLRGKIGVMMNAMDDGVLDEGHPGIIKILAESVAEVDAALGMLEANRAALPAGYIKAFESRHKHHRFEGSGYYLPSFLVPPPSVEAKKVPPALECCANSSCAKKRLKGEAKFAVCSSCKSASYCSKDCQRKHWKTHKLRCKTSSSVSDGSDSSTTMTTHPGRPSLVLPLDRCPDGLPEFEGKFETLASFQGLNAPKRIHQVGVARRNIHGDNIFLVKIQIPTDPISGADRFGGFVCMVYDEERSFNTHFASGLTPEAKRIVQLVQTEGVFNQGWGARCKGFFEAVRDGPSVRVFCDHIVTPVQPW